MPLANNHLVSSYLDADPRVSDPSGAFIGDYGPGDSSIRQFTDVQAFPSSDVRDDSEFLNQSTRLRKGYYHDDFTYPDKLPGPYRRRRVRMAERSGTTWRPFAKRSKVIRRTQKRQRRVARRKKR